MSSIKVLSCLLALLCWLDVSRALGQSKGAASLDLEIQGGSADDACLTTEQLRARIAHYSSASATRRGLRLVLQITGQDAAELSILRGSAVVARRSFAQLPAPCEDRRDAVALSIALALERAATSPAAPRNTHPEPPVSTSAGSASSSAVSSAASGSDTASEAQAQTLEPEPEPEPVQAVAKTQPSASREQDTTDSQAPVIPSTLPSTTSRDPRRAGTSSLQLHLGGRFTLGAVPVPVWVGALGIELPLASSVTLDLTVLVSSVGESALAGARARASLLGVEAVGCGNIPLGIFMFQACGGAAVALCDVRGVDYPRALPEATLLWAAGLGRATLRWPRAESFALRLLVQPHVSISRPELRVDGSTERLRGALIGGTTGLELWLALP